MTHYKTAGLTLISTIFLATVTHTAYAGMWDDPQNIKALAEDITPDELRDTMRGFAIGTGSRCSTCHVYENEADLRTYDFPADDKEKKQKAREMIHLVRDINTRLSIAFEKSPDQMVQVECATCHRGNTKPEKIQDVLSKVYRDKGMHETTIKYRELRDNYYGGYTYDFSEPALVFLAEQMVATKETEAALGLLDLNLEFYPRSSRTLVLKGQILAKVGDKSAAKDNYRKALEIEPGNAWIQRLLDSLDKENSAGR